MVSKDLNHNGIFFKFFFLLILAPSMFSQFCLSLHFSACTLIFPLNAARFTSRFLKLSPSEGEVSVLLQVLLKVGVTLYRRLFSRFFILPGLTICNHDLGLLCISRKQISKPFPFLKMSEYLQFYFKSSQKSQKNWYYFTEHWMVQVRRDLQRWTPLLKAGSAKAGCAGPCVMGNLFHWPSSH